MSEALPQFRYHPDPLATGAVEPSDATCVGCGAARGFLYVGPVYSKIELGDRLCPWCIADGTAANQFAASFADAHPLLEANLPAPIVEEIHLRTPAYTSWQQEEWLAHCGDACEFHGDATSADVAEAAVETKTEWMSKYHLSERDWAQATAGYRPGGESSFYKFSCRHCKSILFGWDCS